MFAISCYVPDQTRWQENSREQTVTHCNTFRVSEMMVSVKTNNSVREKRETLMPAGMLGIGKLGSKC